MRADEHLADIRQRLAIFIRQHENVIISQFNTNRPQDMVTLIPTQIFAPMSIAIRIGEICYNLRTALEYLVFELAKLDCGVSQKKTQFPIEDTAEGFQLRLKRGWLKGLNTNHITAIERLQPYQGCGWSRALRDLSNKDKHREFPALKGRGQVMVYTSNDWQFASLALPVHRALHPVTGKEMDVKVDFQTEVAFDDGTPVVETLVEIKRGVAQALADFKLEF